MERGTGITTRQIKEAPYGSVYIWVNADLYYPKELAKLHGRKDLKIVSPSFLDHPHHIRGMNGHGIVIDHATNLTKRQWCVFSEWLMTKTLHKK